VRKVSFTAVIVYTFFLVAHARASSFHWVDRDGFHEVDEIGKVPLANRRELSMARNRTALPFSAEENRDGAMYVWFVLGQTGFDYPYTPARDFPKSRVFKKVEKPRAADIAWWPDSVALYGDKGDVLLSARGEEPLKVAAGKHGPPVWYRFVGSSSKKPVPGKRAPQQALRSADDALRKLDGAAWFPPRVKNDAELDRLGKEWKKTVADLETLRRSHPDDPQVLRRLGACYRMGHNLDMPGAWERAEAYLLRAEELAPDAPEAYISLGILYADTDFDHAEQAESQFRQALRHARQEQQPQVWWGLALSLYYQGKIKEAVQTVDRVIARHPEDVNARKLRETILAAGTGKDPVKKVNAEKEQRSDTP
jgi:hypothetical protein